MKTLGLIIGILAIVVMIIGFFPCLGSLNWINIPIAVIGLIISIIAYSTLKTNDAKGGVIAALILNGVAIFFGLLRLILGGGVF